MRITLVLAATIIVTQCGIQDVNTEAKTVSLLQVDQKTEDRKHIQTENQLPVSLSEHDFSGTKRTLMKKLRLFEKERNKTNQKLEEVAANAIRCDRNVDNFVLKAISEENKERIPLQGDIILTERKGEQLLKEVVKSHRLKRQIYKKTEKWSNGVFYTFNTSDENVQKMFKVSAKEWSDLTCVDFVENKSAEDKVIVEKTDVCWAEVGRRGGEQHLFLSEDVTRWQAAHEIGHILGLLHTMQRHDRDQYITIKWENMEPSAVHDFTKDSMNETDVYGLAYDYGSIMHYYGCSFSVNEQLTILANDALHQNTMGSYTISFSDIFTINTHYKCNEICDKSTSAKCANEGFPHPRNCSICICPSGYGGRLCDRRPPGCGEDLVAERKVQTVRRSLGFGSDVRELFDYCYYMITAPKGKRIKVKAHLASDDFEMPGCQLGGIEIKAQKDQKMTGYRFCSRSGNPDPIASYYSHLPLIIFNRFGVMRVRFMYYYVD